MRSKLLPLLLAVVCAGANAQTPSHSVAPNTALIGQLTHGQVAVDRTFNGPGKDITGVVGHVVSQPEHKVLFWVVDGAYVINGPLLDAQGQDLSLKAAIAQGIVPKPMPPAEVATQAARAPGFVVGHAGPLIMAFEDPNCSACRFFMQSVAGQIKAGQLRVKIIPVGMLKPDSLGRAATILSSKNPAAAWQQNEAAFDLKNEEGGYPVMAHPSADSIKAIQANTALLAKTGKVATPAIVSCDGSPSHPTVTYGYAPGTSFTSCWK